LEIIANLHELKKFADQLPIFSLDELNADFLSFSRQKKYYDQIKFLNKEGMEVVQVDYNNGKPSLKPQKLLQNKAHRYYFKDSIANLQNQ